MIGEEKSEIVSNQVALNLSVSLNSLMAPHLLSIQENNKNHNTSPRIVKDTLDDADSIKSMDQISHRTWDYIKCSNKLNKQFEVCKSSKLIKYIDNEVWSKYSLQEGESICVNLETKQNILDRNKNNNVYRILKMNQTIPSETNQRKSDHFMNEHDDFNFRSYLKGLILTYINMSLIFGHMFSRSFK